MPFIYVDVEVGVSEEGVCCKIVFPVKFQAVKFHENRHKAFILLKLFHTLFAIKSFCC